MAQELPALRAGFARLTITPPLGLSLGGHGKYDTRRGSGIWDELEVNTIALSVSDSAAVLMSVDVLFMATPDCNAIRERISAAHGIPKENIFIACTHTHTAPMVAGEHLPDFHADDAYYRYKQYLFDRLCDSAALALADRKPARMGWAVGSAPGVSYVRRCKMKDGTYKTNPPIGSPDIEGPVEEADRRVNVLRFLRQGGEEIALVNVAGHPDTLGSIITDMSADYPRVIRETVEAVLPAHCVFFNGCQGDVNATDRLQPPMEYDEFFLKNETAYGRYTRSKSANGTQHIGRAIAGALLQVYGDVHWVDVDTIRGLGGTCAAFYNKATAEELVWAREFFRCFNEGLPTDGPKSKIHKAKRMLVLEKMPDSIDLSLTGLRIGPVAFLGIPGEPFNRIGMALKENSPFTMTLPCCLVNGSHGYIPTKDAYEQGGYETDAARFRCGTAEAIIETGSKLLRALK